MAEQTKKAMYYNPTFTPQWFHITDKEGLKYGSTGSYPQEIAGCVLTQRFRKCSLPQLLVSLTVAYKVT